MKHEFDSEDYLIIAVDPLARFAIRFASLKNAVKNTLTLHRTQGLLAQTLAEFIVGGILLGSRSDDQESYLYKLKFTHAALNINLEVNPRGAFRVALFPAEMSTQFTLPITGLLHADRLIQTKELYQSIATINPQGIQATLTDYLGQSLQRSSLIQINANLKDPTKNFGLWIEKLPETPESDWLIFKRRFDVVDFFKNSFAVSTDPDHIMNKLFPEGFKILAITKPRFDCGCSKERILKALVTLSESELIEIFMEGTGIVVNCDYCRKEWRVTDADVKSLIKTSSSVH